jgi:alpha-beta hydrolase superfamily lysophospholipase
MFAAINNLIYNFLFYIPYDLVENRRNILYSDPVENHPTLLFEENYFLNDRNIKLYYQKYYPKNYKIISKIFFLHGYASNNSYWAKCSAIKLAKKGHCVYMLDSEGHGKSDGLWAYIKNFTFLVNDHYNFIKSIKEYPNIKTFLWGDSMGGAISIKLFEKDNNIACGSVLVAPMIKISDEAKPSKSLENILIWLAYYLPTWPILPNQTSPDSGFHPDIEKHIIYNNPLCYNQKPRLGTALQLYNISCDIEKNIESIKFPFIVIHGKNDKLTDWEHSQILYDKSTSQDKQILIYDECYHCLLEGPYKNKVYKDVYNWLQLRA